MQRWMRMVAACTTLALLVACSGKGGDSEAAADAYGAAAPASPMAPMPEEAAAGGATPGASPQASTLAYEHTVQIVIAAQDIAARAKSTQQACLSKTFGDCVVLSVRQSGGERPDASITVRIAPAGVEPMIAQAGQGAEVGSRSSQAEDLAVVVRDNDMARQRLRNERERLSTFLQRSDLTVADMIALSKQLAETDAQLQAAEEDGAQHRRRIDTQLLTINYAPPNAQLGRSEIGQALGDFSGTMSSGVAVAIRVVAAVSPFAVVLVIVVLVIRRLRRKRRTAD